MRATRRLLAVLVASGVALTTLTAMRDHRAAMPADESQWEVRHIDTRIVPGRLKDIFNDTNALQLQGAAYHGIPPIKGLRDAYHIRRPLVKVETCRDFVVDTLRMSVPYLVPQAASLLHDLGRAFSDTVRARGGGDCRLRVTSVLRTTHSVSRLKRRNRAATEHSCHRYATTFDVSWTRFDDNNANCRISLEDLKNVLAEVVYDLRRQGRCYAIFERRQGCFHITVR